MAAAFADGGWLCDALHLEHRPEQERMAHAVGAAMKTDQALLCEAGTGVGKSLAYLVPGIILAVDQKRQLVVSTNTISLQEQLEHQDLPLCRRLFAAVDSLAPYRPFKSALLVGKSNYLCTTRLAQALRGEKELFATAEQQELQRIATWATSSRTGLRHELSPAPLPEVWDWVNAESGTCCRKNCDADTCFYQRARSRLRDAQVIIVNHSLLFALIAIGGESAPSGDTRGVLFPDDLVVIDEAHTVPDVATNHFGLSLSSYGLDRLLKALYHPDKKRGLLQRLGAAADRLKVIDALEASAQFFGYLDEQVLKKKTTLRMRESDVCENGLDEPLARLISAVDRLAGRFDEGRDRDELLEQKERLKGYQNGLRLFLGRVVGEHVYWLERGGRRGTVIHLRSAPLDVAARLRAALFHRNTAVVLTSATLAMGGAIEPFQIRVGAEHAVTRVEKSPFDFERHMRIYVAADVSPPSPKEGRLDLDGLVDYLEFCTLSVAGGSLVLFTSYQDMRLAAQVLEPLYHAQARPFLMQGAGGSRTELTRRLRKAGNAILFGTDSFWTGVDVPGTALSQVVITRLPFDLPTHPVAEARAEWVRDRGGNPFAELTLPEALVKFRQGVGRLIRNHTDRGLITILDSRVLTKTYGRDFLGVLPTPHYTRLTRAGRARDFRPFPCGGGD